MPDTKTDESGHGSCVYSKAAGALYGVSSNADVVIVKVPNWVNGTQDGREVTVINIMSTILEQVRKSGSKKNIINISWG